MSFADQALCRGYMVKNHASLEKRVYTVPVDLDKRVAKLKLESMGIKIDRLTPDKKSIWQAGTKAPSGRDADCRVLLIGAGGPGNRGCPTHSRSLRMSG